VASTPKKTVKKTTRTPKSAPTRAAMKAGEPPASATRPCSEVAFWVDLLKAWYPDQWPAYLARTRKRQREIDRLTAAVRQLKADATARFGI